MPLGRMRNQVDVLKRTVVKDTNGEPVETWTSLGHWYAERTPRTAREIDSGRVITEENTFDFRMHYNDTLGGLKASDQIHYRGSVYELTGKPKNLGGRDRFIEVPTRVVEPSGVELG